ncbi:MAG TPA: amino acid ABC transporter permease [Candidatus Mailhella merdavium]|nr:amino acid ABC transporter permease [Candidatus Mailhella merdavium]
MNSRLFRPLLLLCFMVGLIWLIADTAVENYRWQWYRVWPYVGTWEDGTFTPGPLLTGLALTLKIVAGAFVIALFSGAALAFMRLSPSPTARLLAGAILGLIRNTPLLMQIFIVYFVLAPMLNIGADAAAALSLGLFEGCYVAEIFRAGIVSLPRAQWEAAFSLGFGMPATLRLVIIPQALRRIIAPLSGQIVSLIKDSSLVSAIAVADLTLRGREAIAESFLSFEIWLLVAGIYLGLTLIAGLPALWLEKHTNTSFRSKS